MILWALFVGILLSVLTKVYSQKNSLVLKCLGRYVDRVSESAVSSEYIAEVMRLVENLSKPNPAPKIAGRVVLEVGLGSIVTSQFINHMVQLNVSGIEPSGKSISNCKFSNNQSPNFRQELFSSKGLVALSSRNLTRGINAHWLQLFEANPNMLVVMNDISDYHWYHSANGLRVNGGCRDLFRGSMGTMNSMLPTRCYLPMLDLPDSLFDMPFTSDVRDFYLSPHRQSDARLRSNGRLKKRDAAVILRNMQLDRFPYEFAQPIIAAYRDLITCVVPPKQLLRVTLNENTTSAEYWQGLTRFLSLKVPPDRLSHLIDSGTQSPLAGINITPRNRSAGHWEIQGSVCEAPYVPASDLRTRMDACAARYVNKLVPVLGQRFRGAMSNEMLSSFNLVRRAPSTTEMLTLGVGPGTSGTRSLWLAMMQLNFTGNHWGNLSSNCSPAGRVHNTDVDLVMKDLPAVGASHPLFWSDEPVPHRWWRLFRMYPLTKIIMTDVADAGAWQKKRAKEHCDKLSLGRFDCMPPLAFRLQDKQLHQEMLRIAHVAVASSQLNEVAWDAYRELLRCAIPPAQLKWMYFQKLGTSAEFWNSLIDFVGVAVSPTAKQAIIDAGIPRLSGVQVCTMGNEPCKFRGRPFQSAIVPSVCAPR